MIKIFHEIKTTKGVFRTPSNIEKHIRCGFLQEKFIVESLGALSRGITPRTILHTFLFSTEEWGRPPTYYNSAKSNSQAIFHMPPLSTNPNAPGN